MNSYNIITHHQLFRDIDMPFNLKNFREMSWTVQNVLIAKEQPREDARLQGAAA